MLLKALCKGYPLGKLFTTKTLLIMKFTAIFLLSACLTVSAIGYSQKVSLSGKNVPLEKMFSAIETQTNYVFFYNYELLNDAKAVSIDVKDVSLQDALKLLFKNQPLDFIIKRQTVFITKRNPATVVNEELPLLPPVDVKGRIVNENGEPVVGASVKIKGTNIGTSTNENGEFVVNVPDPSMTLLITAVNIESAEVSVNARTDLKTIVVRTSVKALDAVVVNKGYYTTSERLNTGNVAKVTAEEISKQPVSNPLAALYARVPGLVITQSSGLPGSAFNVRLRGRNSINSSNDPLFIIDGVPFAPNNNAVNQIGSALGSQGLSPFSSIMNSDIESIEILKDADATAIYGSRGANGVILITTKKGKAGKLKVNISIQTGAGKVTRTMDMMNTQEYLQMRREAFANDNRAITNTSAPDLMLWDTTRYTDFKKLLIGGTAKQTDIQTSVSGGSSILQFLVGSSYHHETTVFPGDLSDSKASLHFNINYGASNSKFKIGLTGTYLYGRNNINVSDLTSFINLPPNLPSLYDSTGKLNWREKGVNFTNPLAYLLKEYVAKTDNLITNLKFSYSITKQLDFISSFGFNSVTVNDYSVSPIASQNPFFNPVGFSGFGYNNLKSLIVEPQLEYKIGKNKHRFNALMGTTWQQNENNRSSIDGYGYTSDALIRSISAAPTITSRNNYFSQYRYAAFFSRINYSFDEKYILNLIARRDGSSRFGPGKQFSNFGSAGFAWLFNKEKFVIKNLPFISYGKLRLSYGTTGNDQINDYQYLNTWTSTSQGPQGLYPSGLFNPDYRWEENKKFESALELGLFKDAILFTTVYFNNRSDNQLVQYSLPSQTGGTSITANFPAKVENKGLEFEISSTNIKTKQFSWQSSFNLTIPKNKLLAFPDLSSSNYSSLVLGEPLNLIAGFNVVGVDPQTGVYQFLSKSGQSVFSPSDDDYIKNFGTFDPKYYGGLRNTFRYKGFGFESLFELKKQTGLNYFNALGFAVPGTLNNQPDIILNRWRKPGDQTNIQKVTTRAGNPAFTAALIIRNNGADILYSDASFIRLKNISLSYDFPERVAGKIKATIIRLYLHAQNLFTITNYLGSDPETQGLYSLPPLKTFSGGIQITF